jgi:hypothetical protein
MVDVVVVVVVARVWAGGVAGWLEDRLGLGRQVLGVDDGEAAVRGSGGRRRREGKGGRGRWRGRGRGSGRLGLAVKEVVDLEVGGEGEAALGVEAVEP